MTESERADLAHDEAIEHVASEVMSAAVAADGSTVEAIVEDDTALLPGETRSPRNPSAPREDFARIGTNPRSRFQRPQRGGHGPHRGHHGGHAPSRRPQLISEMLKAGQDVVVQIAKEPLGKKGARITSHVALPGRFLVY